MKFLYLGKCGPQADENGRKRVAAALERLRPGKPFPDIWERVGEAPREKHIEMRIPKGAKRVIISQSTEITFE